MNYKVSTASRVFILKRKSEKDNVTLTDPNPEMTPEQVMKFYSAQYPELTTSTIIGPNITGESVEYQFQTIIGEKG